MTDPTLGRGELETLARAAGARALEHFRAGVAAERKQDRSVVTVADREVETFIRAELERIAPRMTRVGEEKAREPGVPGAPVVVIDPIDGTGSFVAGLPTWAISIGVLDGARAVAGVVHLPVIDELYVTAGDERPVHVDPSGERPLAPLEPATAPLERDDFLLIHSSAHHHYRITFPAKTRNLGTIAYHLALVARGSAPGVLLGRPPIHDLCAGVALLHRVGGSLLALDGSPVSLEAIVRQGGPTRPIVAAAPGREDVILEAIEGREPPREEGDAPGPGSGSGGPDRDPPD